MGVGKHVAQHALDEREDDGRVDGDMSHIDVVGFKGKFVVVEAEAKVGLVEGGAEEWNL